MTCFWMECSNKEKYQMQDCLALICIKDVRFHPRPEHEPEELLGRGLSGRGKG